MCISDQRAAIRINVLATSAARMAFGKNRGAPASSGNLREPARPSLKCLLLFTCVALLDFVSAFAIQTSDFAVQVSAQVETTPPRITLSWPQSSTGTPSSYIVSRKNRDATFWEPGVSLPGATTAYSDSNVTVGSAYEYQVKRVGSSYSGYGYVYAGIEVPVIETRGKVLLIVDNTHAAELASELSRLEQDLIGDGWTVIRHDVARTDSPASVKGLIQSDYAADPSNVKSVFLFGRVPVPYSGNRAPDGHNPDHLGAWPADLFYAEMEASWSDGYVNVTSASDSRHHNIPGDGKYDQSQVPSRVKLQLGRVDLSDMPAFGLSEKDLLRQYLNKDHNFRHKLLAVRRRGLVVDAFGTANGEAFAASGWRNFAALLGTGNVTAAEPEQFISSLTAESYLWAYGCGPGTYTSAGGIGTTSDFAANDLRAVFTMLLGSYFGDWDSRDNLMRAMLATPNYGLTCAWAGRPHWFFHHMGLGEPIGYSALVTQNNTTTYQKANFGAGEIHIALMGDPTLRLHPVAPPTQLTARAEGLSVTLDWVGSADAVLGYNVYRAATPAEPFTRVNEAQVQTTSFTDSTVQAGQYTYQVRAEKLESSGSGSYYNLSQGAFASVTVVNDAPAPIPVVSVIATDPEASEVGLDPGRFTISLSSSLTTDLNIVLDLSGSAGMGTDYLRVLSGIVIPAGRTSVQIRIVPLPDSIVEETEIVTLAVVPDAAFTIDPTAASASVALADGPILQRTKIRRR